MKLYRLEITENQQPTLQGLKPKNWIGLEISGNIPGRYPVELRLMLEKNYTLGSDALKSVLSNLGFPTTITVEEIIHPSKDLLHVPALSRRGYAVFPPLEVEIDENESDENLQYRRYKPQPTRFNTVLPEPITPVLKNLFALETPFKLQIFAKLTKQREPLITIQISIQSEIDDALEGCLGLLDPNTGHIPRRWVNWRHSRKLNSRISQGKPYTWFSLSESSELNQYFKLPNLHTFIDKQHWPDTTMKIDDSLIAQNLHLGIRLGSKPKLGLFHNQPFYLPLKDLTNHLLTLGNTGWGKTRHTINTLGEFDEQGIPWIVLDPKGEYFKTSSGLKELPLYYRVGDPNHALMINLFELPEGVDIRTHVNFIYSLLRGIVGPDTLDYHANQSNLLRAAIKATVTEGGNLSRLLSLIRHPAVLNVEGVRSDMSGMALLSKLETIKHTPYIGDDTNINFLKLLQRRVVIDLSAFEQIADKGARSRFVSIFYHFLLATIRQNFGEISNPGNIKFVLIFDEAQKIVPQSKEYGQEIHNLIAESIETMRARGGVLWFISPTDKIDTNILTQAGNVIMFRTKIPNKSLEQILSLSVDEIAQLKEQLANIGDFVYMSPMGEQHMLSSYSLEIPPADDTMLFPDIFATGTIDELEIEPTSTDWTW